MTECEKPAKILIVEDDVLIAKELESRLKGLGYAVCGKATTGIIALDIVKKHQPDLILMDIVLKGEMDGIEVSEVIRDKWGIPVVFLTAYADTDRLERAKLTYPFGYLLKPFQDRDLKVATEMALYVAKVDVERRKTEEKLAERVKELNCLYNISRLVETPGISLDAILQGTADLIPQACQHPELTSARIILEGQEYRTRKFQEHPLKQNAELIIHGVKVGSIEVCCLRKPSGPSGESFIAEEQELIEAIAERLGRVVERVRTRDALQESEQRLRNILVETPQIGIALDPQARIVFANRNFLELTGWKADEIMGRDWFELFIPEDIRETVKDVFLSVMAAKDALGYSSYENEILTKRGERCNVAWSNLVTKDLNGAVVNVTCLGVDLTDRKRAEEELCEQRNFAVNLLETAQIIIMVLDAEGRVVRFNKYMEELTGYQLDEVKGKDWFSTFLPGNNHGRIRELFRKAIGDIKTRGNINPIIATDGREIHVEWYDSTLKDYQGNIIGLLACGLDVSDRKRAEDEKERLQSQLQQSQKMEAIGVLAGGIAHDFNNLLAAMTGYTELASHSLTADSIEKSYLGEVLKAGKRAKELIRQILAFSRPTDENRRPMEVQPVIKEAVKFLWSSTPTYIEIEHYMDQYPIAVFGDPSQVSQIVMNLCTNAIHAIGENNGTIRINLERILVENRLDEYPDLPPGEYGLFTVTDNGCGMNPEAMTKVFDPFFTTKERGRGTGLGLSVVNGIVESMDGKITVASELGRGTTFKVFLPSIHGASETESVPQGLLERGVERILVVDDEEVLAEMMKRMLEKIGYGVTSFSCPMEALKAFREDPTGYDLVVTDHNMPRMTGLTFGGELMKIRLDIPLILCTGFSENVDQDRALSSGFLDFLMKPVPIRDLAQAVRRALDAA